MKCKYCNDEMVLKIYKTPQMNYTRDGMHITETVKTSTIWACQKCHFAIREDDDEREGCQTNL
jgi:hypothetical protein